MSADKRRKGIGGKSGRGDEDDDSKSEGNTAAENVSFICLLNTIVADQQLLGIQSVNLCISDIHST